VKTSTPDSILRRVDWEIVRRLDGLLQGDYRSLLYGAGVDFADLRLYQPGDDVRYIDWNVTARLGDPYMRQYVEDREVTGWFLLDVSPSLEFGTVTRTKREALIDFVATFARLLTRHGNRVGAILLGAKVESQMPPRTGRQQVLRLIDALANHAGSSTSQITSLDELLRAGARTIHKRSLVVIVSDFITAPGWEVQLKGLNHRHDVIAVRIRDPREIDIPDLGGLYLEDSETGAQMYVDTHDPAFRRRFREAAESRQQSLAGAFKSSGVDAMWLSTEEDITRAFVRFAALRGQRRRAA
jgi:uncharacterized protein (DUF58 family)